mmetsp:Transcript_5128/g.8358  ORF Transcript_5128/g.8358 Transcript_5128/m.8358 type:complete len:264 (+) Transcript_5128:354-1145(+)
MLTLTPTVLPTSSPQTHSPLAYQETANPTQTPFTHSPSQTPVTKKPTFSPSQDTMTPTQPLPTRAPTSPSPNAEPTLSPSLQRWGCDVTISGSYESDVNPEFISQMQARLSSVLSIADDTFTLTFFAGSILMQIIFFEGNMQETPRDLATKLAQMPTKELSAGLGVIVENIGEAREAETLLRAGPGGSQQPPVATHNSDTRNDDDDLISLTSLGLGIAIGVSGSFIVGMSICFYNYKRQHRDDDGDDDDDDDDNGNEDNNADY